MIRTILRMTVHPGGEAEFERRFADLDVLGAAARVADLGYSGGLSGVARQRGPEGGRRGAGPLCRALAGSRDL